MKVTTPWTADKVKELNEYQSFGRFHPYTCPGDLPSCKDSRNLIATENGWVCHCGEYKQGWSY